jgi:diketogulonate reductase-like aldo/keto reductase
VASGVPRSEIFTTSKLDPSGYDKVLEDFDVILKSLQSDYIDLLLIHWPDKITEKPNEAISSCEQEQLTWAECRIQT